MNISDPNRESRPDALTTSAPPVPASYPAKLYAAVHRGNDGDRRYYRLACAGARDVLELGCGFGRIARALSDDGLKVTGVDSDPDMVALARKAVPTGRFEVADMRTFSTEARFDRVVIPYNGIYCLLSREDVVRTLRLARQHLAPDGLVVFDGYNAEAFHHAGDGDGAWDESSYVKTVSALGESWRVYERSRWDRAQQRIDAVYTHVPDGHQARSLAPVPGTIEACIPQRYLLASQVEGLLADADLELLALQGDFDQSAWDDDSAALVVVARAGGATA